MLVIAFAECLSEAKAMASALGAPCVVVDIHRFPDGESRVRLPDALPAEVVLFRTLDRPNDKLVEVMLAAATARESGVRHLTLVAPYLCYMRQDKAFVPGEAISQRIVGRFLAGLVDRLVTVDPHLHRVAHLSEAVPVAEAITLSAATVMGEFLARRPERPLLLGPDEESLQWVAAVAAEGGLDYAVARKERWGDREVRVVLPDRAYAGREVVLVDDVASTGATLAAAARELAARGAVSVKVLVTHPLFAGDALERLGRAGVSGVWSADSIRHPSNRIALAGLLASAWRAPVV